MFVTQYLVVSDYFPLAVLTQQFYQLTRSTLHLFRLVLVLKQNTAITVKEGKHIYRLCNYKSLHPFTPAHSMQYSYQLTANQIPFAFQLSRLLSCFIQDSCYAEKYVFFIPYNRIKYGSNPKNMINISASDDI